MQPALLKGKIAAYFALINAHPHEDQRSGPMKNNIRSNFDMLRAYEAQLWRLGALAERYFAEDPNTSLLKLRQLSELLAQSLAARTGLYTSPEETQYELIRRLQGEGVLPKEVIWHYLGTFTPQAVSYIARVSWSTRWSACGLRQLPQVFEQHAVCGAGARRVDRL